MLAGEDSLPKADRARDRVIRDYEDIVRKLRTVPSAYVMVKKTCRNPNSQNCTPCAPASNGFQFT